MFGFNPVFLIENTALAWISQEKIYIELDSNEILA